MANKTSEIKDESKNETPQKSAQYKLRLNLATDDDHPFSQLQKELKVRGVKSPDWSSVIVDAFEQVPKTWWEEKLDQLTPLEFKINAALSDPAMREKLTELLAQKESDESVH